MGRFEYIQNIFNKGMQRRFLIFSLVGWLFLSAVIVKMFLGCSVSMRQASVALKSDYYKITDDCVSSRRAVERIRLPSGLEGAFSFLEDGILSDDACPAYLSISLYDVSKIAGIGASFPTSTVETVNQPSPSNRGTLFQPIIRRAAAQYQIDPALVRAIIFAESGYNPTAVSKRGAMGLMQLMPGTAKAMGVKNCFDPEHNIYGGVKYFKTLFNQFDGDVKLALAAYNAGSRKVREFNGVPPFRATQHYIQKVMRYYHIYKDQQSMPLGLS